MKKTRFFSVLYAAMLVATSVFFWGCEGDSGENIARNVELIIQGLYRSDVDGLNLVVENTGEPIVQLDLRQQGDQLEGIDNHGNLFIGTIGQIIDGTVATITLTGRTTAGNEGTISATVTVPEGGTSAEMDGTWAEDTLFSVVRGVATVPVNNVETNGGGGATNGVSALSIAAAPTTINISGSDLTSAITASGGSAPYDFSRSDATLGAITSENANDGTATYTAAPEVGTQTITVTDSDGDSDSLQITQQSSP